MLMIMIITVMVFVTTVTGWDNNIFNDVIYIKICYLIIYKNT